jgi:hypothetical protein
MNRRFHFTKIVVLAVALSVAGLMSAQERGFFAPEDQEKATGRRLETDAAHIPNIPYQCQGLVSLVTDVAYEGVKTTSFNWSNVTGGGESGRYDKRPVLSTRVKLEEGCLNAHFSALVGSKQTYPGASSITMFQVTLTPDSGGAPQHMVGHYDTPYGLYGPAVAIEAERDVDTFGANFFQRVGFEHGDVPPGAYRVDVWWSGGPVGGGGAIGAAFVLKLYQQR